MILLFACAEEEVPTLEPSGWSDGPYLLAVASDAAYFGDTCVIGADLVGPYTLGEDGGFSWSGSTRENASGSAVRDVVFAGVVAGDELSAALRYADEDSSFVEVEMRRDEDVVYEALEFCTS